MLNFWARHVLPVPRARDHNLVMAPKNNMPHHYSVSVKRVGDANHWMWEIQRTPPLGIRIHGENFRSAQAAKLEGEKALRELLKSISNERPDT
jgi:hypothetical protein